MNRIILQLFAVGFCFVIGQALECYKCKIGVGSLCITSTTTCNAGEQCYSGSGQAGSFLDIKMKGCLPVAECNKTSDVTIPGDSNATIYTMTKTCCNTNLCNAAAGPPGVSGLGLAMASFTALLVTKILV